MELHVIAHNLRSAENIGALFRMCDSLGVAKLWITGYSPTPRHRKVAKTALGAETSVSWEFVADIASAIARLRVVGCRIVGLEKTAGAMNLVEYVPESNIALLLGNEVDGVTPSLLALCDDVIAISQRGIKTSLNVAVAAGIAAFWMMNRVFMSSAELDAILGTVADGEADV